MRFASCRRSRACSTRPPIPPAAGSHRSTNTWPRSPQGNDGLDANQRSWAHDAALAHRKQAVDWTAWVKAEGAKLAAGQGYLEKGSFRERYTKGVEDALMGVRNKL